MLSLPTSRTTIGAPFGSISHHPSSTPVGRTPLRSNSTSISPPVAANLEDAETMEWGYGTYVFAVWAPARHPSAEMNQRWSGYQESRTRPLAAGKR